MQKMSQAFQRELRREHQYATKVEMLDTDFKPVEGKTLFSANNTNEITNFISDGNIDVDTTRGTRRTAELTLLNPSSEFTPATAGFDATGPWTGEVYLNRIVRIHRGLYVVDNPEYVCVGTFMIDNAEVISERNMSLVVITLSDLWKKLSKSYTLRPQNYPVGTAYVDILLDLLAVTGADEPLAPIIDNLSGRSSEEKTISEKLTVEEGTSRGDKMKELAEGWDIDVYFDPYGRFILQDRKDAKDKIEVWQFYSSADRDGMLTSLRRAFTDDNLYNHVIVVGGGDTPVRVERIDTDPRSNTNVNLIGDRVLLIKDDKVTSTEKANKALDKAWANRFQIAETITAETICNPALEGDDVIRITERDFAKVDATYRLAQFTVPLVTTKQTLQATNIRKETDF